MTGPVQVLVVGFDRPTFSGEVLAEFTRLRDAGIVRLVDLLVISRTEDGAFETLTLPEGVEADFGDLAARVLGQTESSAEPEAESAGVDPAPDPAPTWSLSDAIPVGSTAAVALIEHTWARPLSEALQRAGGTLLDETWLAREDRELLEALIAER
ncbi:MAG TPA: DUF6325 family protein [Propionibacteriaceae bacterium]|nr:DUF6325 family protein [Propionibacteriaceae bacterium]